MNVKTVKGTLYEPDTLTGFKRSWILEKVVMI